MPVKRFQVRDEDGQLCTAKCWVTEAVGGYQIGIEILAKHQRFDGFSDACHENISWYDVRTQLLHMGYKIVEDIFEY